MKKSQTHEHFCNVNSSLSNMHINKVWEVKEIKVMTDIRTLGLYKFLWMIIVQLLSCVQLFAILWTAACQTSLSFTISWNLLTHVHWVGDAIQPFCPLSSLSHPAFNLSQHQVLSQWVNSLYQLAKVLGLQLQHQSFQWLFRIDFL